MSVESEYDENLDPLSQAALDAVHAAVIVEFGYPIRDKLNPAMKALLKKRQEQLSELINLHGIDSLNGALNRMVLSRLDTFSVVRHLFLQK